MLLKAFLSLRNEGELKKFLRDLMTENEIEEFSKRIEAAELLSQEMPYASIVKKTGLSSTTVARVAKWLHGTEGGYRSVLRKIHVR